MLASILIPLVAVLASTPALGRISNFSFPTTAYLGETLQINATEEIYIQKWSDLGVLFGLASKEYQCGTCVGQGEWYQNLYNEPDFAGTNGTKLSNYTIDFPVVPYLNTSKEYIIVAAVPYIAGASGATGIRYFNQSITLTPNPNGDQAVYDDADEDSE